MTKYILFDQSSSGLITYKCDFVDPKFGHTTRTTMKSMAKQYDAAEALEIASTSRWYIETVYESPPALQIRVSDRATGKIKAG